MEHILEWNIIVKQSKENETNGQSTKFDKYKLVKPDFRKNTLKPLKK